MARPPKPINKKAYKKSHEKCFFCEESDYAALQCHRIIPGEKGGTYHESNTLSICANCHCKVHAGNIKIDRKYKKLTGPNWAVRYWIDEKEYWKDELLSIDKVCQNHLENTTKNDSPKI